MLLTKWGDGEPFDPGSVSEFLDDNERTVIERLNEWITFVDELSAPRPLFRIATSDTEAAALDAEDKREAEIDALPYPGRALKRLDQGLDHLIATLTTLKTELQTFREQDSPDTPSNADEDQQRFLKQFAEERTLRESGMGQTKTEYRG